MTISKVSNNLILRSDELGCVFTNLDGALFQSPLFTDDSYDDDEDCWIEVDFLSLLGEEQYIQDEINRIDRLLVTSKRPL